MKTNVIFAMAFLLAMPICAQVTYESNNPIFGTPLGYIGWYGSAPLDFRTNDIVRMRMMESGTTTIDNYTINHDGFVGLSTDPSFFNLVKPFSLLHLNGSNNGYLGPQQQGYRPWMKEGIVFTQNSDLMYVGPLSGSQDITDAVIA